VTTTVSLNFLLKITAQFDDLAKRYSEELAEKRVLADVGLQDKNHDVSALCVSICSFMQSQGFSVFGGEFPAVFTSERKSLLFCDRFL
jgi:hypothetical protein